MNKSKLQRLLGAALVAALLTATLAPVAMAAVPAAEAQQVSAATEVSAMLPGGQFTKIWLALSPDNPGSGETVTVTAEWDRSNAAENGVGFYILNEDNLTAVVNGAPLPANNIGAGSSKFFLNGPSNVQGANFNATGANYTVVLFNDSNSDANVKLAVDKGTISDDSGQVKAPGATADATTETAAEATAEAAATVEAAAATTATTQAAGATATVAATTTAAAAATPVATVVPGGPVRAESMQGELPEQFAQHFLALEPTIKDGEITLVLTYDPQDSTELARRINFWVLDSAGFVRYQDGESASDVAIAAGTKSFLDPDTSNKREASFKATGFGPYTVIVQNNSRVPATYELTATGGVLIDDSAQTLTAQQAGGTAPAATVATTATTTAGETTAATTTTAAGSGVAGKPGGTYTVAAGDTLAIIARDIYGDYRLYEQLCAFNKIADCNVIEVGQVINLPTEAEIGAVAAPAAAATTAATPAAAATPEATATTAATTAVTATTPVTGTSAVTSTASTTSTTGVGTTGTATQTTTTGSTSAAGTILDVAQKNGNFTILLDAVQQAGLEGALSGSGPFTVLAPTDAAFEALLNGNNLTEEQLLQAKELADILQYHVLSGKLLAADMTNGSRATTLQGKPVTFEVKDGKVYVNGAQLVTTDIPASNGVIQAIDAVILPPQ